MDSLYESTIRLKYGEKNANLLSCLGKEDQTEKIAEELESLVASLEKKIKERSAELFGEIANLSYKVEL